MSHNGMRARDADLRPVDSVPVSRAGRAQNNDMVEQPSLAGWVNHWSLTVPLPDNVADRPDLRWANAKGEQGFVFDWPTIHNLLGRVGSDTAWSWVRIDELKTGAWVRVSGRAPRQLAVEIGDPGHDTSQLAVHCDSDPWPRRDIGTHGWTLLVAVGELLDTVDAYLTCRAWFQRGVIPSGIVLRSMRRRRGGCDRPQHEA